MNSFNSNDTSHGPVGPVTDAQYLAKRAADPVLSAWDAAIERTLGAGISPFLPCDCPACTAPPLETPYLEHESQLTDYWLAKAEREATCEQRFIPNPVFREAIALLTADAEREQQAERGRRDREYSARVDSWNCQPYKRRTRSDNYAKMWAEAEKKAASGE